MATVGYIRVSSTGQNLAGQRDAVLAAGAEKLFEEKKSGVDSDRKHLAACLDYLREGDTLVLTKADRLARSAADLLKTLQFLDEKGVGVKFLEQPQLSTTDKYGKFMLTVLSGVAELEREIIKERQRDGIKAAKKRGVKFGRKPKINEKVIETVKRLRVQGLSVPEIGDRVGLKRSSVYNALNA
jgi:DNA invertase Pin-like site-specific DNA recombinase